MLLFYIIKASHYAGIRRSECKSFYLLISLIGHLKFQQLVVTT